MAKKFSPSEDNFLRENYMLIPAKRMSKMLGRTEGTARQRMKLLGLTVPAEVVQKFRKESQFKKGTTPGNKGLKQTDYMSAEAIRRCSATRFKKGSVPVNHKHDGAISIRQNHPERNERPYKYIRISNGKWEQLHVYVWKQANGPVPSGMVIVFINGDTMNCDLSNLKLITRQEHIGNTRNGDGFIAMTMARVTGGRGKFNRDLKNKLMEHPDLIDLKRNQMALKRTINERKNSAGEGNA